MGRSSAGSSPRPASAGRSRTRSTASPSAWSSRDFAWAVMAIRIQREVGGNLAELLDTVADTMTQRERLRRDVDVAHRRGQDLAPSCSASCPSASGLLIYVINPDYMDSLFDDDRRATSCSAGRPSLMLASASAWMKKIIKIEI